MKFLKFPVELFLKLLITVVNEVINLIKHSKDE